MIADAPYRPTAAQLAAWRRFCALVELDRRVRDDPRCLSAPPRATDPRLAGTPSGQTPRS